jgi:enoyl-[acyl-carrier protein] reductase II
MLRTPLCDLLGIELPILQAPIGPSASPELAAAVSNTGGLGSVMFGNVPAEQVKADLARLRELTDRPFAVNQVLRMFNEEAFALTLEAHPAAVWFALGDPGDLAARAHAEGRRVIHQVHSVAQALQAVERGVDVIVAQGGEAGGFGGAISTLTLVPQVVDAVAPVPVVAAGGIADGRGVAAAFALGAQGVNIGTRFLASSESRAPEELKRAIVAAESSETVKAEFINELLPIDEGMYETFPRVLRTPFVDRWNRERAELPRQAERVRAQLQEAMASDRAHELLPLAGQSAGLVHDVRPAAEIVRELVRETEAALARLA